MSQRAASLPRVPPRPPLEPPVGPPLEPLPPPVLALGLAATMTTRTGRPDGLTKARQDAICDGLRAGLTLDDAAVRAGVSGRSARRWRERGSGDSAPKRFRDFLEATDGARVDLKFADLDGIGAAGGEDWRARAWRLERLFPGEFGRQTKHQHTGPEGGPIGIEVGDALGDLGLLSDEGLDQLAKLMAITHGRGHSGKR